MNDARNLAAVFDQIMIRDGERWRQLAVEDFFAMPLSDRVKHVLARTVSFRRGGNEVDQKQALAALRRIRIERTFPSDQVP